MRSSRNTRQIINTGQGEKEKEDREVENRGFSRVKVERVIKQNHGKRNTSGAGRKIETTKKNANNSFKAAKIYEKLKYNGYRGDEKIDET